MTLQHHGFCEGVSGGGIRFSGSYQLSGFVEAFLSLVGFVGLHKRLVPWFQGLGFLSVGRF